MWLFDCFLFVCFVNFKRDFIIFLEKVSHTDYCFTRLTIIIIITIIILIQNIARWQNSMCCISGTVLISFFIWFLCLFFFVFCFIFISFNSFNVMRCNKILFIWRKPRNMPEVHTTHSFKIPITTSRTFKISHHFTFVARHINVWCKFQLYDYCRFWFCFLCCACTIHIRTYTLKLALY